MRNLGRRVLWSVGIAGVAFVLLNAQFFWVNFQYTFSQPPSPGPEPLKMAPNTLLVASLRIKAPVHYVAEDAEAVFQQALQNGVVHYPGTAQPGEPGNVYIFGHSSDNAWAKGQYKTVFALLPRIEKGAPILLSDAEGRIFTYLVRDNFSISVRDRRWLSQENSERRLLTLQTSYPVGTSLGRYIVVAELTE